MNFFIADTHIGHENCIKFDRRPFENAEEMFQEIKARWNARVTPKDTVYILGDFIAYKEPLWANIVKQLNGKKVLVRGNHDPKVFSKETKALFVDIVEKCEIKENGRKIVMCHFPEFFFDGSGRSNAYMLYGHVHTSREAKYTRMFRDILRKNIKGAKAEPLGQLMHVGCMEPYMDYTPRTLDEIIEGDAATYPVRR